MKLLLDTHIFLWYITGDRRLPAGIKDRISDPRHEVFLSVVSVWEATVKYQLGKLTLPGEAGVFLPQQRERHGITSLGVDEESVAVLSRLDPHHRDPFDRLLICQAIRHELTIATVDDVFPAYPVTVLSA